MDNDLISRSELIEKLPQPRGYEQTKYYLDVCKTIRNTPTIEQPQGEWIPVSERLPNCNGCYNVTRKLKEGETIYFISDVCYFDGQNTWHRDVGVNHGRPYLTDIIAWRPLPEPYKRGEENEIN